MCFAKLLILFLSLSFTADFSFNPIDNVEVVEQKAPEEPADAPVPEETSNPQEVVAQPDSELPPAHVWVFAEIQYEVCFILFKANLNDPSQTNTTCPVMTAEEAIERLLIEKTLQCVLRTAEESETFFAAAQIVMKNNPEHFTKVFIERQDFSLPPEYILVFAEIQDQACSIVFKANLNDPNQTNTTCPLITAEEAIGRLLIAKNLQCALRTPEDAAHFFVSAQWLSQNKPEFFTKVSVEVLDSNIKFSLSGDKDEDKLAKVIKGSKLKDYSIVFMQSWVVAMILLKFMQTNSFNRLIELYDRISSSNFHVPKELAAIYIVFYIIMVVLWVIRECMFFNTCQIIGILNKWTGLHNFMTYFTKFIGKAKYNDESSNEIDIANVSAFAFKSMFVGVLVTIVYLTIKCKISSVKDWLLKEKFYSAFNKNTDKNPIKIQSSATLGLSEFITQTLKDQLKKEQNMAKNMKNPDNPEFVKINKFIKTSNFHLIAWFVIGALLSPNTLKPIFRPPIVPFQEEGERQEGQGSQGAQGYAKTPEEAREVFQDLVEKYGHLAVDKDGARIELDGETYDRVFRAIAFHLHPDRPRGNAEVFKKLGNARDVLRDKGPRGLKEKFRLTKQNSGNVNPPSSQPKKEDVTKDGSNNGQAKSPAQADNQAPFCLEAPPA